MDVKDEKPVKRVIWTDVETDKLLTISRDENIEQLVAVDRYRSIHCYNMVADKLNEFGYNRSGEQIRTKLKALRKDYNRIKIERTTEADNDYNQYNDEHLYELLKCVFDATESKPVVSIVVENEQVPTLTKRVIWLDNETTQMLYIVQDENILQLLASKKYRKLNIYKKVSDKMQDLGYDRVPFQIKTKLKSLRKEYDCLKSQSTISKDIDLTEMCSYFNLLDEIFGKPIEPIIPPKIEIKTQQYKVWSSEETELMLSFVCEENNLKLLHNNRHTTQNMDIYREVAAKMWNSGFYIGATRVRTKLVKLRKEYAKIKKNIYLEEHEKIEKVQYYEILDYIFGRYYKLYACDRRKENDEDEESIVSSSNDTVDAFMAQESPPTPPLPESLPSQYLPPESEAALQSLTPEYPSKLPSPLLINTSNLLMVNRSAQSSPSKIASPSTIPSSPPIKKIKFVEKSNPELEELEQIDEKLLKKNHDWLEEQMEKQRNHEHNENILFNNEMTKIFNSFLSNLNEMKSETYDDNDNEDDDVHDDIDDGDADDNDDVDDEDDNYDDGDNDDDDDDNPSNTATIKSNSSTANIKDLTSGCYIIYE